MVKVRMRVEGEENGAEEGKVVEVNPMVAARLVSQQKAAYVEGAETAEAPGGDTAAETKKGKPRGRDKDKG
jgi:hypothetical protein